MADTKFNRPPKKVWRYLVLLGLLPLWWLGSLLSSGEDSQTTSAEVAQATESIFVEVDLLGDDKLSEEVDFYQFPGGWCYWWHHVPTGTGVAYDDGTRGLLIDSVTGNMMNYGWKAGDVRFTGPVGETLVLRFAPPPPGTSCT